MTREVWSEVRRVRNALEHEGDVISYLSKWYTYSDFYFERHDM